MALWFLCVGLTLLAVGLFAVTEFEAERSLRIRGWLMMATGFLMFSAGCYMMV